LQAVGRRRRGHARGARAAQSAEGSASQRGGRRAGEGAHATRSGRARGARGAGAHSDRRTYRRAGRARRTGRGRGTRPRRAQPDAACARSSAVAAGAPDMTPLAFEERYEAEWQELEVLLERVLQRKRKSGGEGPPVQGERLAALYRRACEHLALARARSYPAYMVDRLDRLTAGAHQVIYQQREVGVAALRRLIARDFPVAVRAHARYVWLATALLALPTIIVAALVYARPEFILSVVDAGTAASFEEMYSDAGGAIGRAREAGGDWAMFGYYIRNNVGV